MHQIDQHYSLDMDLMLLSYICVGVCAAALIGRTLHYLSMPLHLRWELYPVPHEKGKSDYGGSYFEELNWWEKPIEKDHIGAIKFLLIEVLLVKSLFHDNRKLWFVSYPFDFANLRQYFPVETDCPWADFS